MLKISDHGGIFGGGKKITFGTATANDVLSGKTLQTENGIISGTIPLKTGANGNASTGVNHHLASNISPTAGTIFLKPNPLNHSRVTYEGDCWISHNDANFNSANIAQGKTVLGMTGSFTNDATATANQILSGNTAYVKGSKVTGSISSKGAQTFTPSTSNQTINAGQYLSGTQTITGDADLIASNIISGKNIFGVAGSATVASLGGVLQSSGTVTALKANSSTISMGHTINIGFNPRVVVAHVANNGYDAKTSIIIPVANLQGLAQTSGSFGVTLAVSGTNLIFHQNSTASMQVTYYAYS